MARGSVPATFCVILSLLVAITPAAADGLSWKDSTIRIQAGSGDKKAEAEFVFTNSASVPIEIRSVRTSCGCTTADLAKKVYQPGETGSIKAVFTFGGRKGVQEKSILVRTSAEDASPDILILRVEIPDVIAINKERLTWQAGDPLEVQSFDIQVLEKSVQVKGARALGDHFEAKLVEVEGGKSWRVEVLPKSTEKERKGTVRLDVADPSPRAIYLKVGVDE